MKSLLPQHLSVRVIVVVVLTLIATQLSFGWMMTRMQDRQFRMIMRRNASVMATNIAHGASHHLVQGEMKELEDLLRQSLQLPNIWKIMVTDPQGRAVMAMERVGNGDLVHRTYESPFKNPAGVQQVVEDLPGDFLIWEPISHETAVVGWLQATYTLKTVQQMKVVIWQRTLLFALLWIVLGAIVVILTLRRTLASVARLAEFAHNLPEHKGEQVDVPQTTIEIRHLADSINLASRELKARDIQVAEERQHLRNTLDELQRTEAKARKQEQFLTTIVESLTHPFYVIDAKTYEIILANSAARQGDVTPGATCHGVTHQSPVPCNDVEHPCPLELVKQRRRAVMVEHVHQDHRGVKRTYEVHGYPIFGDDGEVVQMLEYSLDVTDRKVAQEDVRRNESRLAALFRISQIRTSSVQELLDAALNEALLLSGSRIGFIFRYDEESRELTLSSWSRSVMKDCEIAEPDIVWRLDETGMLGDAIRNRQPVMINDVMQPYPSKRDLPAGHVPVQRFLGVPVFDGDRIVALLGVANREEDYSPKDEEQLSLLMDSVWKIVERMLADAELRRLNEELEERVKQRTSQLEEANRELESFCYSVSHDLRAPLRHVDGYSQLLVEDYSERIGEAGGHYLKRMRDATIKMGLLIDDLLQLSRVTRSEIEASRVNLSAMVAEILTDLQATNPDRRAEFQVEDGIVVMGDPRLLRVAMDNLLRNAWKYSSRCETAVISFGRTDKDGRSCLFVGDNGAGFDMAYADKLFAPFQRLHRVDEFEGTGVGLATVMRIISRHGGTIWAEAAVDEGATFYFTLPLV